MDAFFEGLIKAKVPKIAILAILFWAGVALINNSSELFSLSGITGLIIILIGVLLSMISFLDYRYKDSVDNAIAQLDKAIDSLGKTLKNTQKTNTLLEKSRQGTLNETGDRKIGKPGKREYSLENQEGTLTE